MYVFDGQQVTTNPALSGLQGAAVRAIDSATSDVLWLATARGLYAMRSGKLLHIIEGSDARSVFAVPDSQKIAWCATDSGLQKVLLDDADGAVTARVDANRACRLKMRSRFSMCILRQLMKHLDRHESRRCAIRTGTGCAAFVCDSGDGKRILRAKKCAQV